MDAPHVSNNYRLFANSIAQLQPITEKTAQAIKANCQDISVYAGILLREFKALVETLAQLNEGDFQLVYPEVYTTMEKLTRWFDETSSTNTIELYSALRHLKQKARNHVKNVATKKAAINGNGSQHTATVKRDDIIDYLAD